MNTSFDRQKVVTHGSNFSIWSLGLAGPAVLVCLAVLLVLQFPEKTGPFQLLSSKGDLAGPNTAATHRVPKGQLQADVRTLVAAISWLLEPEPDYPFSPWNQAATPFACTNPCFRPTTSRGIPQPSALFAASSNQPAPFHALTTNQASHS